MEKQAYSGMVTFKLGLQVLMFISVSMEHENDQSFYTFGGIDPERAGVKESE